MPALSGTGPHVQGGSRGQRGGSPRRAGTSTASTFPRRLLTGWLLGTNQATRVSASLAFAQDGAEPAPVSSEPSLPPPRVSGEDSRVHSVRDVRPVWALLSARRGLSCLRGRRQEEGGEGPGRKCSRVCVSRRAAQVLLPDSDAPCSAVTPAGLLAGPE